MAITERCALSDLPADQCGCHKHRPDGGQLHIEPGNTHRGGGHAYGATEVTARYPGKCVECGERYEIGETIRPERFKTIDAATGSWAHTECADDAS